MKKITITLMFLLVFILTPVIIFAAEDITEVKNAVELIDAVKTSGTIKLTDNINLDERLLINTGVNITLDLNGKKLDLPTNEECDNYGITVKGTLTIQGNGTINFNGYYGIGTSVSGGNVIIKNGTFNGMNSDYMLGSFGGKIVIENGMFYGNYCVINAFVEYTGTAEVKGGILNNNEDTVVLGNTKVSGGSFDKEIDKQYLSEGKICPNINDRYVVAPDTKFDIIIKDVEGGKATVDKTKAQYGEVVNVKIETAEGYEFKYLEISTGTAGGPIDTISFLMTYEADITITPVFESLVPVVEIPDEVAVNKETEEMLLGSLEEILKENKELATLVKNNKVEIEVVLEDIKLEDKEKEVIEKSIEEKIKDIKVAKYLDISVNVKIKLDEIPEGKVVGNLEELKEKLTFTVAIPTNLPKVEAGYSRTYYIIRNHDGVVEILETKVTEDGKSLNFDSDKFSTYAIAYVDEIIEDKVEDKKEEKDETPKTGTVNFTIYVVIAIVVLAIVKVSIKRKKGKYSK